MLFICDIKLYEVADACGLLPGKLVSTKQKNAHERLIEGATTGQEGKWIIPLISVLWGSKGSLSQGLKDNPLILMETIYNLHFKHLLLL